MHFVCLESKLGPPCLSGGANHTNVAANIENVFSYGLTWCVSLYLVAGCHQGFFSEQKCQNGDIAI
jgi:hypothetical protein